MKQQHQRATWLLAKKQAVFNSTAFPKRYGPCSLQTAFFDGNWMFKLAKVSTGEMQKEDTFSSTSTDYMTAEQRLVDKTCFYNMGNADHPPVLHFMTALLSFCAMFFLVFFFFHRNILEKSASSLPCSLAGGAGMDPNYQVMLTPQCHHNLNKV